MKEIRDLPMPYKLVRRNENGSFTILARFAYTVDCHQAWSAMRDGNLHIAVNQCLIDPKGIPASVVTNAMLDANGLWFIGAM